MTSLTVLTELTTLRAILMLLGIGEAVSTIQVKTGWTRLMFKLYLS